MYRVLILCPTHSYRCGDFLRAAQRLGALVTVGTDQILVIQNFSNDAMLQLDFGNPHDAAERILSRHQATPFDTVVGVDEQTSLIAAIAAGKIGLSHNPPQAIRTAHDKHAFRCAMARANLPGPEFRLIQRDDNARDIATTVRYPSVLKPLRMSASRGVIRVDHEDEFVAARERIFRILDQTETGDQRNAIHVEDFIPGRELALEGLLVDGELIALALFDKPDPLDGPFFEETLYVTPSRLPPTLQSAAVVATSQACRALGLVTGPVHAELRINDSQPWLIELAARSIGGCCARSLLFPGGIALEELIIAHALEQPIPNLGTIETASGVMMIPVPGRGVLRAVHGVTVARATPGVTDVMIEPLLGQRLVPLPEGDRYLGFIFARAETPAGVECSLRLAHSALHFELASDERSSDAAAEIADRQDAV